MGTSYAKLVEFARGADLLLNVSGMLRDERLRAGIPVRAYLDLDPGFNQVWHQTGRGRRFRRAHPLRHRRTDDRIGRLPGPHLRAPLDSDQPTHRPGAVAAR